MEDETPKLGFLKRVMSSDPEASYGRAISACAFVSLLALHIIFSINPYSWFKVVENQPQVLQYLFILVISGYSITSAKDMVPQISTFLNSVFKKKVVTPQTGGSTTDDSAKAKDE